MQKVSGPKIFPSPARIRPIFQPLSQNDVCAFRVGGRIRSSGQALPRSSSSVLCGRWPMQIAARPRGVSWSKPLGAIGRSRMRESLMYGSVRGARGNSRPYRDPLNAPRVSREKQIKVAPAPDPVRRQVDIASGPLASMYVTQTLGDLFRRWSPALRSCTRWHHLSTLRVGGANDRDKK